jgi:hypothetical protein
MINLMTPRRQQSAGNRTGWLRSAPERRRSKTKSEMREMREKKRDNQEGGDQFARTWGVVNQQNNLCICITPVGGFKGTF